MLRSFIIIALLMIIFSYNAKAMDLITNVDNRSTVSLNGRWNVIVDPYETGYYDYRYELADDSYFLNEKPIDKTDRVESSFDTDHMLQVPGDWNSQEERMFFYEGTVWYHRLFDYQPKPETRVFLYFGAINYKAIVSINTDILGEHEGGFTPFNFEITNQLREKDNFVIVKADNKRLREAVPTVNTDWFNYGGLTRRVMLIETPETFIRDYLIQLAPGSRERIAGWVQLDGTKTEQQITVRIPEAGIEQTIRSDSLGRAEFDFSAELTLWSPDHPKLYEVEIECESDQLKDRIGFRTIETRGNDILLNGNPAFLRGICIHEEAPFGGGARAFSPEHARTLLGWAKELNCNFVRLAHYPHNEYMTRIADEMGLMVWSEIPVYWTILWENQPTFDNAANQLEEMILRDKNKASVILWSVANETPVKPERTKFLTSLVKLARKLDNTRLITAALEKEYMDDTTIMIDDPLGRELDVVGCNQYLGWYDGLPAKCDNIVWRSAFEKPVIISEFGGGALFGLHGDELTRWSEEFQASVYRHNLDMLDKVKFIKGMTPWILKDFRSPKRQIPRIQDLWNRKGLISDRGERKQAFDILRTFYGRKKPKN
ncbi:MAG: beta-glucuronidase [Chloroflexi bacterium]|jgi:beta-glucuronidase|nr:beta-glucuronidase [Chloroflexota bacterium]